MKAHQLPHLSAIFDGQKGGEPNRTYASQMSYAPHGALAQCIYGNNLIEQTTFNSRLQPTLITLSSNPVLSISLNYGTTTNNGNVVSQTISQVGTQSYTYDDVNRLKTAQAGCLSKDVLLRAAYEIAP